MERFKRFLFLLTNDTEIKEIIDEKETKTYRT